MKRLIVFLTVLMIIMNIHSKSLSEELSAYIISNRIENAEIQVSSDTLVYATIMDSNKTYLMLSRNEIESTGYQGKTKIAVRFDTLATIISVKVVDSDDTRSFVRRLKRSMFLEQFIRWNGKSEIVSKTGVTFTSDSITSTVLNIVPYLNKVILSQ